MPRRSPKTILGHRFLGRMGQPSQFMSRVKLCSRRKYTLVETVPFLIMTSSWSARVSTTRSFHSGPRALSFETFIQRVWLGSLLSLIMKSTTSCQVQFWHVWISGSHVSAGDLQVQTSRWRENTTASNAARSYPRQIAPA